MGVYWKPIYAISEGPFEIVVANAQHPAAAPVAAWPVPGSLDISL